MKSLVIMLSLLVALGVGAAEQLAVAHSAGVHRAFPVTIVDDLHTRVRIPRRPVRIVSLDPRDTETLFALGLEKWVVGDGGKAVEGAVGFTRPFRYPGEWPSAWGRDYPIRSRTLTHVEGGCCGTPWNLETIANLHPDLILTLNSDVPTIQKMRDLGFKVMVLDPANILGIMHDIALVGAATGAARQAGVVVGRMKQELAATRLRLKRARGVPRVYYEIDATNPTEPYTAGPHTFIDDALRRAGGHNVAAEVAGCSGTTCYPQVSLEALVRLDPQIILLGDAAYGTTPQAVKNRSGWDTISAVKSDKIYPFNDELISRAGPRIVIGLTRLERLLHPEAF